MLLFGPHKRLEGKSLRHGSLGEPVPLVHLVPQIPQRAGSLRGESSTRRKVKEAARTFGSGRVLAAVAGALLCLSPAVAQADPTSPSPKAPPAKAPPSIVLVQESNGFPGGEKTTRLALQKVAISGGNLRVLDVTHGYAFFVDLNKKEVFECDLRSKEYVHHPFSYYKKYRDQRTKTLADQRDEFVRRLKRLEGKVAKVREWKNEYRKIGGDPEHPGKLVAKLQHYTGDAKTVDLMVDRELKKVRVEHYIIRENQGRPIFDLWVTKDVKLPVNLFRFYRELGTFSAPVTKKLLELEGTIVQCEAVIDTGSFHRVFKTRVKEVRHERPTLPPIFVAKKPWKEASKETKAAPLPKIPCALCGKPLVTDKKKWTTFREPWGKRRTFYVDSATCRRKLVKKLVAERRKQKGR
jgi:hypothetical protein